MKLNRRGFLKWLGIGAAGAALARIAGTGAAEAAVIEPSSQVGEWTPSMLPPHESLEPYIWIPWTSTAPSFSNEAVHNLNDWVTMRLRNYHCVGTIQEIPICRPQEYSRFIGI